MKNIDLKIGKEIKIFLVPVITIAVVFILTGKFIIPNALNIVDSFNKNKEEMVQLEQLEIKAKKLISLRSSPLLSDFTQLEKVLPSEKNVSYILTSLAQLEAESQVVIEGLSFKPGTLDETPPSKTANIDKLTLYLSLAGSEEAVLDFLDNLTKTAPLFNITAVSLNSDSAARVNLNLITYYMNLPTSIGKLDSPLGELSASQKQTASLVKSLKYPSDLSFVSQPTASSSVSFKGGIFGL